MRSSSALVFFDLLTWRLTPSERVWIEEMNALLHPRTLPRGEFLELFRATARSLKRVPLEPQAHERERLAGADVDWPLDAWTFDELGRVVLLLIAAAYLVPDELETLVGEAWSGGDVHERAAVLKALPLLPRPARFVPLARRALSGEPESVLAAIACENPYPARYFPDEVWNFLALAVAERGLPLSLLRGLAVRWNPPLAQLAADLVKERLAAGQPVPADIDLLLRKGGLRG
jgi:hypothetical protein